VNIISVEISRPGQFGLNTSATLEMPATWAEFQDAKEKARITDDRVIFSHELCYSEYDWLTPHIDKGGSLLELNLLATRMEQHIKDKLDVFEAMVKIETRRGGGQPLSLPRLINLTFSIENCHVAGGITNDAALGEFLYENDMLHQGDDTAVFERIGAELPIADLCAMLGKEHRDNEGGVFTGSGKYVEFDGVVNEVYVPGEMVYFNRTGAPVVLEVSRNGKTAMLNLPETSTERLNIAKETLDTDEFEKCEYHCTDCLIPDAKEWIDAAQDIKAVVHFARELDHMERYGGIPEYKALLEAAKCDSLETAVQLAEGIEEYRLVTECYGPTDYALEVISKPPFKDIGVDIGKHLNHFSFGKELMAHNNIEETSYGLLSRKDGGLLFSEGNQPGMGMEMR
jgi:hypothetical protein